MDVAAGKTIAERQCRPCHALDGRGSGPAIPTLAGQPDTYLLAAIGEYKDGRRNHAALRAILEGLSDADTRNVAAYFASLPPIAASSQQSVQLFSPYETGQKLAAVCGQCHGQDGNSTMPGVPSLAGQQPRYFASAIHEYLDGSRGTPSPMHLLVRDMRAVEVDSVALYFAAQTPVQRPPAGFGDAAEGEPHTVLCTGCHGLLGVSTDPGNAKSGRPGPRIPRERNQVLSQCAQVRTDDTGRGRPNRYGRRQYRRILHDPEVKAGRERPGVGSGIDTEMQSVSRPGSSQCGCGDPEVERPGHGLFGHGTAVVSRQQAPDLGDAQYGPALR